MFDFIMYLVMRLGAGLALLALVIAWGLIIFVVVDEIIGFLKDTGDDVEESD